MVDFTTVLDFIGTYAFAISGIRLAARKEFDLFGAFVVGLVTAVGGGTLRDLMLGTTPFWMKDISYILVTILAMLTVVAFRRYIVKLNYTFFIFDAIGLGFFTVVGFEKSMMCGFPTWVNVAMGCITGAAGGIIRDILLNEVPLIFRKDIYAMACFAGGFFYWALMRLGATPFQCEFVAALSVILIRVICVQYRVSLPAFSGDLDKE